ncbi:MAG TPA: uracil phosphoribosyltransferase [Longimicrobiales bacterium]|nr:uracil phosphoribosyltransferase [Longimicrobiales bacterium]
MRAFPNLTVVDHPLIQHKLAILRHRTTPKKIFRELVDESTSLLASEVTRELPLEPVEIETPLEQTTAYMVSGKKLVLVPILRAGLGMVEPMLRLMPSVRVGHIGLYRDHDTLQPVEYYFKIPPDPEARDFIILDPMLATGGSIAAAATALKQRGAQRVRVVSIVSAPEGVQHLLETHPDVQIFTAALDRQLSDHGYILPGLGDAGDRLFGTR